MAKPVSELTEADSMERINVIVSEVAEQLGIIATARDTIGRLNMEQREILQNLKLQRIRGAIALKDQQT